MRRGWLVAFVLLLVAALGGAVVIVSRQRAAREEKARERQAAAAVGTRWLQAWARQRYAEMDALTAPPDTPGDVYRRTDRRLRATSVQVVPGPPDAGGRLLPFNVHEQLAGLGAFDYAGTLDLTGAGTAWKVAFRSSTLHPALARGQRLDRRDLPGGRGELVDRKGRGLRAASADLAGNVLGRPGRSGLERVADARLRGTGGSTIVVRDSAGAQVRVVTTFPAKPPEQVRTTLDLDVQRAAERALAGAPARAALVAVDAGTGELRALANTPITGRAAAFSSYAPGSVFKVVTATAALQAGLTPASRVDCPATFRVQGRAFRNAEAERTGPTTLLRAFAASCNTAFLGVASRLPDGALQRAAALYGFGRDALLPIAADGGSVPPPLGATEAAADAIGQGRVEASPLLLASMSAAVASGTWRQPHLLAGSHASTPLPAATAAALRQMMRAVVTSGTGRAAQGPGGPVSGKTGTAQYGAATPPLQHAWFTGFRGATAFCVFVETGQNGGVTAAPIARRFLAAVPG